MEDLLEGIEESTEDYGSLDDEIEATEEYQENPEIYDESYTENQIPSQGEILNEVYNPESEKDSDEGNIEIIEDYPEEASPEYTEEETTPDYPSDGNLDSEVLAAEQEVLLQNDSEESVSDSSEHSIDDLYLIISEWKESHDSEKDIESDFRRLITAFITTEGSNDDEEIDHIVEIKGFIDDLSQDIISIKENQEYSIDAIIAIAENQKEIANGIKVTNTLLFAIMFVLTMIVGCLFSSIFWSRFR